MQLIGCFSLLVIIQVLRGSGKKPSVVGIKRCDTLDWTLFVILILSGVILTYVAMKINFAEYEEKLLVGYHFTKGDQKFSKSKTVVLASIAFTISFLCVACGVGPGLIFIPVMI